MGHRIILLTLSLYCLPQAAQASSELLLLTVDKANLRAELSTLPISAIPPMHLSSFRIAIGKEAGDKQRLGDNRTPEGIYFPQPPIATANLLPSKYGPWSVPLNFPNSMDVADGKTGYGIWLHGAGDDQRMADAQVTEGCVAFYNDDIAALKPWLRPEHAVVIIGANSLGINDPNERSAVEMATDAWIKAWRERDLAAYLSHYAPDFHHNGKGLSSFARYKRRVFKSYETIQLTMKHMRVLTHPKYAVSLMHQEFSGDKRYHSHGRKVLYWQQRRNNEGKLRWQIIREQFNEGHKLEPAQHHSEALASLRATANSHPEIPTARPPVANRNSEQKNPG